MSIATVPYSSTTTNGSIADPAGTAITSGVGNGGTIANSRPEQTLLRVTVAAAGTFTLKAGDYPPALRASQGDLAVAIAAAGTIWVGPIESGRFIQSDGSLSFECSEAATVTAFEVANR